MLKYNLETVKKSFGSSIISDVLDSMGYRNQMLSYPIRPLSDDTFIYGSAFTGYTMPEQPLTAQCKVVDSCLRGRFTFLQSEEKKLRSFWRTVCDSG